MMKLSKIFLNIFISLSFFTPLISIAAEQTIEFSDETLQKLYNYRMSVEENAYQITLQLCTGYKYASNIGWSTGAAYYPLGLPVEGLHGEELYAMDFSDQESLFSSMQAWSKIAYEGFSQPFSAIGGMKADFINKTHTEMFELNSWFKSLYSLFLIRSPGFKEASQVCLNTEDENTINQFASTIILFDSVASIPGHTVIGGAVFGALLKTIMWVSKPVIKVGSSFYGKIKNKTKDLSDRTKLILKWGGYSAAGSGVIGVSALTISKIEKRQLMQKELQKILFSENENFLSIDQLERTKQLLQILKTFSSEYETEQFLQTSQQCIKSNGLENSSCSLVLDRLDTEMILLMEEDFSLLKKKESLDSIGQIYLSLLYQIFSNTEISMR